MFGERKSREYPGSVIYTYRVMATGIDREVWL
jgi:hypothetical protein